MDIQVGAEIVSDPIDRDGVVMSELQTKERAVESSYVDDDLQTIRYVY